MRLWPEGSVIKGIHAAMQQVQYESPKQSCHQAGTQNDGVHKQMQLQMLCVTLGPAVLAQAFAPSLLNCSSEILMNGLIQRETGEAWLRLLCAISRADVLRRAIWELPAKPTSPGRVKGQAPALCVQMWHPAIPELAPGNLPWETFVTIASLPHIPVRSASKPNAY